jgi:hypothetical protein
MHVLGYMFFDTWDNYLSLRRIPKYAFWDFAGNVYVTLKLIPYYINPEGNRHQLYDTLSVLHMAWIISSHAYRCVHDPRYNIKPIMYKTLYIMGLIMMSSNKSNENCDVLAFYILGYCLDSIINFYMFTRCSSVTITIYTYLSTVFPLLILKQTLMNLHYIYFNIIIGMLFALKFNVS